MTDETTPPATPTTFARDLTVAFELLSAGPERTLSALAERAATLPPDEAFRALRQLAALTGSADALDQLPRRTGPAVEGRVKGSASSAAAAAEKVAEAILASVHRALENGANDAADPLVQPRTLPG